MKDNVIDGIVADQNDADLETLKIYASQVDPPNCFVELGTRKGGSALAVSKIVKPEVEVYTIDHVDQVDKKSENIHYIFKESVDAAKKWDRIIGVLFVDADHSRAMEDFVAWEKFVAIDGYVLFHDYSLQNSKRVTMDCDKIVSRYKNYKSCKRLVGSSIFIIKKIK